MSISEIKEQLGVIAEVDQEMENAGFTLWNSGGGVFVYAAFYEDVGGHVLVTKEDGTFFPDSFDDPVLVGIYGDEEQMPDILAEIRLESLSQFLGLAPYIDFKGYFRNFKGAA